MAGPAARALAAWRSGHVGSAGEYRCGLLDSCFYLADWSEIEIKMKWRWLRTPPALPVRHWHMHAIGIAA